MSISFKDLVEIYRKSEFLLNSENRVYCLETEEELLLLEKLSSDENYVETGLEVFTELKIGENIEVKFGTPRISFGRFYETFEDFVRADMIQRELLKESPYYIISEDVSSFDEGNIDKLLNYNIVKNLLEQLVIMDSYTDNVNKKLIFFSKKTFELSIDINNFVDDFVKVLFGIDTNTRNFINDFKEWLNDEETSNHIDEKKSILAFVLSDNLKENATILDVVLQIEQISESVQAQYSLYLENFSYKKFVQKLEENTEKFVSKINDTISKILPQFLGLPFLTAIPTALKSGDNWLVYLALIIYSIICIYALTYQKLMLDHIDKAIKGYEEKGKIPEKLREQWKEDRIQIEELSKKQKKLYYILLISAILSMLYGIYKICIITIEYYKIDLCDVIKYFSMLLEMK